MSIFRFIQWIANGQPLQLYGDGRQSRDFTFVDDIARGTILAAKPVGYEIFNLGGGRSPRSLTEVIALIENALGKKALVQGHPPIAADIVTTRADIAKAAKLLGWQPLTSFQDGLARTIVWHQDNGFWTNAINQ